MNIIQEADSPEEILDLVDDHDNVIDTITRKEVYAKGIKNYRVIHAFIKNSEGRLWIPRRVSTKKLYPSALDFSIAGHVEAGETYEEALFKEAMEEVRLDLCSVDYKKVGYMNPHKDSVGVWQKVYEILSDDTPDYDDNEFSESEWLFPIEVVKRYEAGELMKSDIPVVIKHCYLS